MTRTNVKKLAWTLRLIGYGLLISAAAVLFLGTQHASATSSGTASPTFTR
jgi:hypothetical protein